MSQYIIKFSKEGYICYTSHLDLLRLFKRALKKADIRIAYSQGFNPHPKMGFAQPLSLGYSSTSEYLEFETLEDYEPSWLCDALQNQMPEGIRIFHCNRAEGGKKSLAARTEAAEYIIGIPLNQPLKKDSHQLCRDYLAQREIKAFKKQKKTKTLKEVDIKGQIRELIFTVEKQSLLITALLDSGSESNLSPELLITSILNFLKLSDRRAEIRVMRTELIFKN